MKSISKKQNQLEKRETIKSAKLKGFLNASIKTLSGENVEARIFIPKGVSADIIHFDFSNFLKQSKKVESFKIDFLTIKNEKLFSNIDWSERINSQNISNVYALNFETYSSNRLDFSKQNLLKYTLTFLNGESAEVKVILPNIIDVLKFSETISQGFKRQFNIICYETEISTVLEGKELNKNTLSPFVLDSGNRLPLPSDIMFWTTRQGVTESVYV